MPRKLSQQHLDVDFLEAQLLDKYDELIHLHLNRRFTGRTADFHLQLLFVAPHSRREGIGEQVVQEIVQAADRSAEVVTLNINPQDNTPERVLRSFYEQHGWKSAHNRPDITADMYRPPRGRDPAVSHSPTTDLFDNKD